MAEGTVRAPLTSRRSVLRAAGLGLLALPVLGGCSIRLEDDAPPIPLLQRKSVPDEALLVGLVQRTTDLAQAAGRVPGPSAAVTTVAATHRTQATVLRGRLTAAGVPNHVIDAGATGASTGSTGSTGPATSSPAATPSRAATPTAAVSAPAAATPAEVADGELALLTAVLPALPGVTADNRAVVASVTAAAAAAAELLGGTPAWPDGDALPPAAAVPLLESTRAAAYAFQVVAAQSSGDQRTAAEATRATLADRADALAAMAGSSAPLAPLGYALPFPVTDGASAGRLATQVLTTLVAGGLGPLVTLPEGSSATTTLLRLLVEAERLGRGWGVGLVPFPGQAYP